MANMMAPGQILVQQDPAAKRRRMLADQMMQEGASTAPVSNIWQGLARVLQGGVGGYLANKEDSALSDRQNKANQALSDALKAGRGQAAETKSYDDGHVIDWNAVAPDKNKMYATLLANPDTASMGAQAQFDDMQNQQERQQKLDDLNLQHKWNLDELGQKRTWDAQDFDKKIGAEKDMAMWKIKAEQEANRLAKTGRIVAGDEAAKLGFAPGTVLNVDAYGNPTVVQKPGDSSSSSGGLFQGTGVEAQALNYAMSMGMPKEEAIKWALQKTVSGPEGQLQIMAPSFGGQPSSASQVPPAAGPDLTTIRQGQGREIPAQIMNGILENTNSVRKLDEILGANGQPGLLDQNPDAIGLKRGLQNMLPGDALNRIDPEGSGLRAIIADIGSMKIHDRSGSAVSASEFPRLQPFIPTISDSPEVVKKKLTAFRKEYQNVLNDMQTAYSPEAGYRPIPKLATSPAEKSSSLDNGPVQVSSPEQFAQLPSGAEFIAPDGARRRKP